MALSEAVTQGHLAESEIYRSYLEKCLLCGACEEACPSEVKTLSTMLQARERLARNVGIKPGKRLILEQVVADPRLLDLVMRTGRTFQGLMFKKIPAESGIRRRIPLPLITADRTLPSLARTFFTDRFSGLVVDAIVTGCASCGENLKENYGGFLRETGVEDKRIEQFISKILDINEYLYRHTSSDSSESEMPEEGGIEAEFTVTYHHPCHLGRLQNVKTEPIALIQSIRGVRYIPMADDEMCCGMGGSFSLEHYDIAREVNDRKVARIMETGADAVVTSCPACMMHIRDGLNRNQRGDIEVLHITELLEKYDSEKQDPVPSTQPFDKAQGPEPVEGEPGEDRRAKEQSKVQQAGP
jgi:Fe-S oxidoreductase